VGMVVRRFAPDTTLRKTFVHPQSVRKSAAPSDAWSLQQSGHAA